MSLPKSSPVPFMMWFAANHDDLLAQYKSLYGEFRDSDTCLECNWLGSIECNYGGEHDCEECCGEGRLYAEDILRNFAVGEYQGQVARDNAKCARYEKELVECHTM